MNSNNFDPVEPTQNQGATTKPVLKDRDSSSSVKTVFIGLLVLAVVSTLAFAIIAAVSNANSTPKATTGSTTTR